MKIKVYLGILVIGIITLVTSIIFSVEQHNVNYYKELYNEKATSNDYYEKLYNEKNNTSEYYESLYNEYKELYDTTIEQNLANTLFEIYSIEGDEGISKLGFTATKHVLQCLAVHSSVSPDGKITQLPPCTKDVIVFEKGDITCTYQTEWSRES